MKATTTTSKTSAPVQAVTTPVKTRSTTGPHATQIFVHWQDKDGVRGLSKFTTKPELDTWLTQTDVSVLNVIRGREKKVSRRIVFT